MYVKSTNASISSCLSCSHSLMQVITSCFTIRNTKRKLAANHLKGKVSIYRIYTAPCPWFYNSNGVSLVKIK